MENASVQVDDSAEQRTLLCFLCFNVLNPNSNDAAHEQEGYKHGSKEFCFNQICKILDVGPELIPSLDGNSGVFSIRLCLKCCVAGENLAKVTNKRKVTEAIRVFFGRISLDHLEGERMRSACRNLYTFRRNIITRCFDILKISFGSPLKSQPSISGGFSCSAKKRSLPAVITTSKSPTKPKTAKAFEGIKLKEQQTEIETHGMEVIGINQDKLTVKIESPLKSEPSHSSGLGSSPRKRSLPALIPTSESPSRPKIAKAFEGISLEEKQTRIETSPSKVPKHARNPLSDLYTSTKLIDDCNYVYSCKRCPDVFSSLEIIQNHIVFAHPEELFPNCQLNGIPDDLYKTTCQRLLLEKLPKSIQLNPGIMLINRCAFCLVFVGGGIARFTSHENQTALDHLFSEHYCNLVELLEDVQKEHSDDKLDDVKIEHSDHELRDVQQEALDSLKMPPPAAPFCHAAVKEKFRAFLFGNDKLENNGHCSNLVGLSGDVRKEALDSILMPPPAAPFCHAIIKEKFRAFLFGDE